MTLEDIENHWLLPILGDQDPAELELSPEELKIEAALVDYFGRKNIPWGLKLRGSIRGWSISIERKIL